ncbi:hypothetical protein FOA52_000752 [Chlamydomonas sp. UWO 241]|nr:hypothetical protein FOA52_000752 [Chlamydomonas sp. UWO 241]
MITVSEPALHELERRLAVVARASEGAGESVRSLTSTTFKRVDEHAAAIQRLTLAMSTNIEDRPTTAAVRNMIESAGSARSEAAAGALLPLWDSVKVLHAGVTDTQAASHTDAHKATHAHGPTSLRVAPQARGRVCGRLSKSSAFAPVFQVLQVLQAGVKDAQAEAKAASRTAEACARETAEGRQRGASDRAGVSALVRRTLEEELGGPGGGGMWGSLPPRVAALEEAAHSTKAQLEVHAQLADRHSALLSAVQEQVGSQLAGARAAAAALRSELAGKVDSVASSLSGRTDLLESSTKALSRDVGVLREGLAARPVGPEVKAMVESGAADAARAAVGKHKEKEDMRWQVWLGQFADTLDRLVSRPDLNVALAATNKQAVRDSTLALEPRLRDIASQLEGARGGAERALRETEARLVAQLSAAGCEWADESKRAGDEARALAAALGAKADAAGVESRLRRLESDVSRRVARPELESELAKKLDVRAFLASSASTSAAAAAGAGPAGAAAAAGGARGGGGAQQQQQQQWGASPGVSPGRPPSFAPGRPAAAAAAPPPSASSAGMYAGVAQHPQHPQHLQHQQHLQQQQAQHHGSPAKLTGTVWLTPVDHPHPPEAHAMATVHAVLGGGAGPPTFVCRPIEELIRRPVGLPTPNIAPWN